METGPQAWVFNLTIHKTETTSIFRIISFTLVTNTNTYAHWPFKMIYCFTKIATHINSGFSCNGYVKKTKEGIINDNIKKKHILSYGVCDLEDAFCSNKYSFTKEKNIAFVELDESVRIRTRKKKHPTFKPRSNQSFIHSFTWNNIIFTTWLQTYKFLSSKGRTAKKKYERKWNNTTIRIRRKKNRNFSFAHQARNKNEKSKV